MVTRLRRDLPMTRGAAVSAVILTFLIITLTAASYALSLSAIHRSARNAATITQLCQAGNTFRAEQVSLWEYVLHASPPQPHQTPAEKAARAVVIAQFTAHLRRVFAARNCQHH